MTTFNLIIERLININDNNIFSYNYYNSDDNNHDKIDGINKLFFSILHNNYKYNTYKNKFCFLKETFDNFYFSHKPSQKEEFLYLFYKIQKTYHTLNKFTFLYKYKRSKLIVNTDLQLNIIKINDTNVICIYHIDSKYLFKIEELIKIIYTSLTNSYSFFSEPLCIKNPYNNVPFGKSILYYIYFYLISNTKIKYIKHEHLDIFLKFKECNFNMTKFVNNYEYILREYSIKNYLNNLSKQATKDQIISMINFYNLNNREQKKIIISDEFPENELIKIMKPYLYLKLVSNFSLIKKNKVEAKNKLNKKLSEFQEFNPQFGRKLIKLKYINLNGKIKKIKSYIEFNMKHKKFNTYEIENFMNNHLSYNYDSYSYIQNDNHDNDDDNYNDHDDIEFTFNIVTNIVSPFLNNDIEQDQDQQNQIEYDEEQSLDEEVEEEFNQNYEYDSWNEDETYENDSIS